ncbi:MAG TPA: hypothetical protein VMH04_01675 [Candidatus Solibacter sp.]|nr:hypothetical protein [Candidatus Solibacter sp.]
MKRISILLLVVFTCFVLVAWPQSQPQWWQHKIITFDVPGAGRAAGQGTYANGINTAGEITGFYIDSNNRYHAFLRHADGTFTRFEAPGAGTDTWQGTGGWAINSADTIAGDFDDSTCVKHGYMREPDGTFTTFEAPGAGDIPGTCGWLGFLQGTDPGNINAAGVIEGLMMDTNNVFHAFLRDPDGTFTIVDAPGAGTGAYQGTLAAAETGLNSASAMTGPYIDANNAWHGYVRDPEGNITTFDAPGASQGTYPWGINEVGKTIGQYADANGVSHAFLRSREGKILTFDDPKAGTDAGQGTIGVFFLPSGGVGGAYVDARNVSHGFVRDTQGRFTTFDAPGAGTGAGQGTAVGGFFGVNSAGLVTGWSVDAKGAYHGFVRFP